VRDGAIVVRRDGEETVLDQAPRSAVVLQAMLAATAAALAVGVPGPSLVGAFGELVTPAHRQQPLGEVGGATIVDDGMATTPAKARATLSGRPDGSVVLIAGGLLTSGGGPVHASPEERLLLTACCDEVGRVARHAALFGEAAAPLARELGRRGVATSVVSDLRDAVAAALRLAQGAEAVVFAPIYPLPAADRARFPSLVDETAAASRVRDSRP
jgi:UDP-N-acetylmuramoylalanine-D-glutamate ligase